MEVHVESKELPVDFHYIEGIRSGSRKTLDSIYAKYFPQTRHLIVSNSGTIEDARDIFQEALIVVYSKVRDSEFMLSCKFSTYLYSICRNLWLKQLRKRDIQIIDITTEEIQAIADAEEITSYFERYQLYKRKFDEMGEQCRKLLLRFIQGADMKTIADEFGFASVTYAKKRKFQCKEQLIARIEEDQEYKRMKYGE